MADSTTRTPAAVPSQAAKVASIRRALHDAVGKERRKLLRQLAVATRDASSR